MAEGNRRSGRGAGIAHTTTATLVFIALAAMALTPANQSPPSIAEFAPQPREQITEAPESQSSQFGSGEGGEEIIEVQASSSPSPSPSPMPDSTEVVEEEEVVVPPQARLRRCVGDPPRQTEDPQSPPCVAFWDGEDNGGATWQGVTADTITIAVPFIQAGPGAGETELTPEVKALEAYFNSRFEFYGRKLKLVKFAGKGPDVGNPEPERQVADAVVVGEEIRAFASLPYADQAGADFYYYDELARRGIVSVYSEWGTSRTQAELAAVHPYQWGIMPPVDEISETMGIWGCTQLLGGTAEYSGQYVGEPRKFGLLTSPSPDGTVPRIENMRKRFSECGLEVATEVEVPYNADPAAQRTALLQLKSEGVTTVVVYSHASTFLIGLYNAAGNIDYRPEWVVSSYGNIDEDSAGLFAPQNQVENSFGLRFLNKRLPAADTPANWAVKEVDPSLDGADEALSKFVYRPLLVLASGIQWAGPNLTPETFGAALTGIEFPNSGAGGAPLYQARVGFGPLDHTFFDDATPIWWDPDEYSYQVNQDTGAYCYVDGGLRYGVRDWPLQPFKLFTYDEPCY